MDESFLLMLSNLLHLQNHLDPTSSLFSDASSASSSSPSSLLGASSSAAPLLFFTIASVLSYVASVRSSSSSSPSRSPSPASDHSLSSFRALSSELIWSMDPPVRDARWRSSYGLSYPVFTTVVDKLKPHIALSNLSLPSDYAVAMVLSRLSRGLSAAAVARRHNLDPFLVSKITNMVTRLLSTKLYPEFIKIPVSRRLHSTSNSFHQLTSLPNVCGAIDSSPVRLRRLPSSSPDTYLSKHGFPSVLLQVVADHNKIFWDVCVKAPGSVDDASHFRDSLLYNRLISGDVVWDKVVNVRGHAVRPYIVGDWCYPLLSFLLTPFNGNGRGSGITPAQKEFNAALMNGRSAVVEALGLLKGRWKILQNLDVGINHAPQTIVACCVLHNLCQIAREPEPDQIYREPDEIGAPPRVLDNERSFYYYGDNLRQILADDLHQRLSSLSR